MDKKDLNILDNCITYGELEAGKALANFISSIDTVTSDIGEYRKGLRHKEPTLIVTGLRVDYLGTPIHILSSLDTDLDIREKFKQFMGKPPVQLLNGYFNNSSEHSDEYKKAVLAKFRSLVNNKQLVVPFKPTEECIVTVGNEKKYSNLDTKILSVLWGMDKETKKFDGKILVNIDNIGNKSRVYKLPLETYGDKFKIASIERSMRTSSMDRRTVSMTCFGFAKPVIIKDKNISLAVDGSNLYMILNNKVIILGSWGGRDGLMDSEVAKTLKSHDAYKHLKNNIDYIEKHRRFMAPYGLTAPVEIIV